MARRVLGNDPDDLTAIRGIGSVWARRLIQAGITTYAQLAMLTPEQLAQITGRRTSRTTAEEWISQARAMAEKAEKRRKTIRRLIVAFALCIAFIVLQVVYNLYIVERVPGATEGTHIPVANEGSAAFFLLPLLLGLVSLFVAFTVLIQWNSSDRSGRLWARICGPVLLIGSLALMFAIPASRNNAWVDFDSQVAVERETRLFPVPSVDHRTSFSDIDYILWESKKGDVLVVTEGGSELKVYGSAFGQEGRRAAQEIADVADKPLRETLTLAYDTWSGTYLPIYVLKTIFEDELGYVVEIVELSVPDCYERVALGRVDIYTDGWFPSQDYTFHKYPSLVKLGQCYGGKAKDAYEGWLVPADFAREYGITHVKDLAKAEVARALDGELVGAPETWLASKRNDEILADYGLTTRYKQKHGSEEDLMNKIDERLSGGKPVLFYLCLPYAYPSKVPLSSDLTWLEGTEERLPLSFVRAVVRNDFPVHYPDAAEVLSRYGIPGADISWSMEQIAQEGESPEFLTGLARSWIDRNRAEVDKWLDWAGQ